MGGDDLPDVFKTPWVKKQESHRADYEADTPGGMVRLYAMLEGGRFVGWIAEWTPKWQGMKPIQIARRYGTDTAPLAHEMAREANRVLWAVFRSMRRLARLDTMPDQEEAMLVGLFQRLPLPGAVFSYGDRAKWLQAAKSIFAVVYRDEEEQEEGNDDE